MSSTRPDLRPPLGDIQARPRALLRALLVVLGVLVAVAGLAVPAASASTAADARNGVAAINPQSGPAVEPGAAVSPALVGVSGPLFDGGVVVSLVTPRGGPGTAIEVHPFSGGATHITTTRNLQRFPGSPTVGGPDGLFVAPTRQIDDLLASGASRSEIEVALGLNKGSLRGGDLVRVDITDPFARGLRLPDPKPGNIHHRPGTGLITGNIYEAVVDSPLKNQPRVLLPILTGRS